MHAGLQSILQYQFEMALQGFFIRGGLSVGRLFVDENSVYGEALLEAYRLESTVAVNPIVVLSDPAMKLVDQHLGYYFGDPAPHEASVLIGPDGRYFLNYLSECILETGEGEAIHVLSLKTHKQRVEDALAEYAAVPAVFAKFSWLATYHNYFCESVEDLPGFDPTMRISVDKAQVAFKKLKQ